MNPLRKLATQSLPLIERGLADTAKKSLGRARSFSVGSLDGLAATTKARRASIVLSSDSTSRSSSTSPDTSPTPLRRRSLSQFRLSSSLAPPVSYFEKGKSRNEYFETMVNLYLSQLPDEQREAIVAEFGEVAAVLTSTNGLLKAEFMDRCLTEMVKRDESELSREIKSRWGDYPIADVESLPGCTNRFSSAVAEEAFNFIASLLTSGYAHMSPPSSIIEIGGFGFSDAFLFMDSLEKQGTKLPEYKGIEIFQKGIVAANIFNQQIAKRNFSCIHGSADSALAGELMETHKDKMKILVALRFISAIQANEVISFFKAVSKFMKEGDVFVFNYTEYNQAALRVGNRRGYSLVEGEEGVYMLMQEKDGNRTHIQTFFTQSAIADLLTMSHLVQVDVVTSDNLGPSGNETSRGQHDPYTRTVIVSSKKDNNSQIKV